MCNPGQVEPREQDGCCLMRPVLCLHGSARKILQERTLKQNILKMSVEYSGRVSSAVEYGSVSGLNGSFSNSCNGQLRSSADD